MSQLVAISFCAVCRFAIAGAYSVAAYLACSPSGIPPKAVPVPRRRAELRIESLAEDKRASAAAMPFCVS